MKVKMFSLSLNKSVLVHEDWTQQNVLVQEEFGLQQDQMVAMEETLKSLKTKVCDCKLVLLL